MAAPRVFFIHPLGVNWMPGETDMSRIANIMAPLGILSMCAWLEQHGVASEVHDCYAFPGNDVSILEKIRKDQPDYIGFSTTTSSFLDGIRLARKIKEDYPQGKIVFGGVHISALQSRLLEDYPVIDFGVMGEGEETLFELIEGRELSAIEGLIYRSDGNKIESNGCRKKLLDMDSLPFPAYEKLKGFPHSYQLPIFNYPFAPNTTVITSRGCPYQCSYCDRSVFGRSYRANSAEYMVALLEFLHQRFHIRHVNIYDDTFTLNRKRVLAFCEQKIRSGLQMTFNCAARAEQIDLDMLRTMKRAGCWMVSLGIETGDPDLLKAHRSYLPGNDPENALEIIRDKVSLIKRAGLRAKGLFMLGLPGETEASVKSSMEYVFSLPLDEFNLSKLTPFPGAPLYRNIARHGHFEENWELMNALNFSFIPKGFTQDRLETLHREFYKRYFRRPQILFKYITMLWHSPDSWKRFLRELPAFLSFIRKQKNA